MWNLRWDSEDLVMFVMIRYAEHGPLDFPKILLIKDS